MITRSLSKTCGCGSCGGTSTGSSCSCGSSCGCNSCSNCGSCSSCYPLWNLCRCCGCSCACHHGSYPGVTPPTQSLPSVLSAANMTAQTVAAGAALPFALTNVLYGRDISATNGGSAITLNTPGLYRVSFHATASPVATAPAGTVLEAQLNLNGREVPGASASSSYTAATDTHNLSFHTVVPVTSAPATLTVNFPTSATVSDSGITVERIGSLLSSPVPASYGTAPSSAAYPAYNPYPAYPGVNPYNPYPAYPL